MIDHAAIALRDERSSLGGIDQRREYIWPSIAVCIEAVLVEIRHAAIEPPPGWRRVGTGRAIGDRASDDIHAAIAIGVAAILREAGQLVGRAQVDQAHIASRLAALRQLPGESIELAIAVGIGTILEAIEAPITIGIDGIEGAIHIGIAHDRIGDIVGVQVKHVDKADATAATRLTADALDDLLHVEASGLTGRHIEKAATKLGTFLCRVGQSLLVEKDQAKINDRSQQEENECGRKRELYQRLTGPFAMSVHTHTP